MEICCVTDPSFSQYGRVLDFPKEFWHNFEIPIPQTGVDYEASYALLEDIPQLEAWLSREVFGTLDIQISYISGHNQVLDGVEWHLGNMVHLASSQLCLLLAKRQDLRNAQIENIRAYYVPACTALELFAETLHSAPVSCDEEGFRSVCVLLRGTNEPFNEEVPREPEQTARNRWFVAASPGEVFAELKQDNIQEWLSQR